MMFSEKTIVQMLFCLLHSYDLVTAHIYDLVHLGLELQLNQTELVYGVYHCKYIIYFGLHCVACIHQFNSEI